jgi:hypothetical protein
VGNVANLGQISNSAPRLRRRHRRHQPVAPEAATLARAIELVAAREKRKHRRARLRSLRSRSDMTSFNLPSEAAFGVQPVPFAVDAVASPPESPPSKRKSPARVVAQQIAAGADWIDQYDSPLGKRKHLSLCRGGVLPCRKNGKQRLVRRADLDAYIMSNAKPPKAADVTDIDRELEALGLGEP